ncbi:MAG: hypothetical protein U1E65_31395 [Myxococcota bacterium]
MLSWLLASVLLAQTPATASKVLVSTTVVGAPEATSDAESGDTLRREVEEALRYVIDFEVLNRAISEQIILRAATSCGRDATCKRSIHQDEGVSLVLAAVWDPTTLECSVDLSEVRTGRSLGRGKEKARSPAARSAMVTAMIERLLAETKHEIGGRIRVTVTPPNAQLIIEPPPRRTMETGRFVLDPGIHRVTAELEGYVAHARDVEVLKKQDVEVELELEANSITSSPWLWVGIGAATLAIATVVVAVSAKNDVYYLCQAPGAAPCP